MGGRQGRRSGGVWEAYGRRNGGALGWRVGRAADWSTGRVLAAFGVAHGRRLVGAQAGYWQRCCGMPGQTSMQRSASDSLCSVLAAYGRRKGGRDSWREWRQGVRRRGGAVLQQDALHGHGGRGAGVLR